MKLTSWLLLLLIGLGGCSSTDGVERPEPTASNPKKLDSSPSSGTLFARAPKQREKALALPPDLVDTTSQTVQQNNAAGEDPAVLPQVEGVEIIRTDGRSWVHVQADVETVWPILLDFWALHDIDLAEVAPASGIMETDWIDTARRQAKADTNATRHSFLLMLNRVVGARVTYDKFRLRLARAEDDSTNIYVTHQATEKKAQEGQSPLKEVDFEWVARDSDPEKIDGLLQNLVLAFGEPATGLKRLSI